MDRILQAEARDVGPKPLVIALFRGEPGRCSVGARYSIAEDRQNVQRDPLVPRRADPPNGQYQRRASPIPRRALKLSPTPCWNAPAEIPFGIVVILSPSTPADRWAVVMSWLTVTILDALRAANSLGNQYLHSALMSFREIGAFPIPAWALSLREK